jgi:hypothetical protein
MRRQHSTVPPERTAQATFLLAATARAVVMPFTAIGLEPQQSILPFASTAQMLLDSGSAAALT